MTIGDPGEHDRLEVAQSKTWRILGLPNVNVAREPGDIADETADRQKREKIRHRFVTGDPP